MQFKRFFLFFFTSVFSLLTVGIFSARALPVIKSVAIIDAESGKTIKNVRKSTTLNSSEFSNSIFDIKLKTKRVKTGSIQIKLKRPDGKSITKIRNRKPYRLGITKNTLYSNINLQLGNYILSAVPYSGKNRRGQVGKKLKIKITVNPDLITPAPAPAPTSIPDIIPNDEIPTDEDEHPFRIWANDGADKVVREDLRSARRGPASVVNTVWNGTKINVFGAKNEVVAFNLVVEAVNTSLNNVTVSLKSLQDDKGNEISGRESDSNDLFNYVGRNIEIFTVRYLKIKGLSTMGLLNLNDERQIPERFRRNHDLRNGNGTGLWSDRPDHDKSYPDIAVPQEIAGAVTIDQGTNQSFWFDIYIPKNTAAGIYSGTIVVKQAADVIKEIPVYLEVRNFILPDTPYAKTMLYFSYDDVSRRYVGSSWPSDPNVLNEVAKIRDRHFMLAHRHRISLIDSNEGGDLTAPSYDWQPRLDGSLFSAENGYAGPGENVGNGVFSIGTYGWFNYWGRNFNNRNDTREIAAAWSEWFKNNAPTTDYFLFLADESRDYSQLNAWAEWLSDTKLRSFATLPVSDAYTNTPNLSIACSTGVWGMSPSWETAVRYFQQKDKSFCYYNGTRPYSGSFMIEDDGVALRQIAWAQYKMGIDRWFYWQSTHYYNGYGQGNTYNTNVFRQAQTFGYRSRQDDVLGETGANYANGDGVLFYPGTDKIYPEESYNIAGPIASLRLKHWRRGIQDVDYLALAAAKNPVRVKIIVNDILPQALWEYQDNRTGNSWTNNPNWWEAARKALADIIEE